MDGSGDAAPLGSDPDWSDAGNWAGGAPVSSLTNTNIIFGAASSYISNLDQAYDVRSLSFEVGAGAYVFTGSTLTVGAGGLAQNAAAAQSFGNAVALGANQSWTLAAGAGALTFSGGLNTAGYTLTLNAADTTSANGNVLAGAISGGGGLTKLGAGTLTLAGNNTYTGATVVSVGTLAVTGTLNGAGALTVAGGAALTGTGTVAGAVNVQAGGTLSAGLDGAGVLTLEGTLALANASSAVFTLAGTTAGSGYTQVRVDGQLTLNGATLVLNEKLGFTLAVGQTFFLLDNTGTGLLTAGTFGNAPGGIYTDAAGDTFLVNYLATDPADNNGLANDVSLTVLTVVPEPSTWTLLGLGATGLLGLNLRRRQHHDQLG